MGITDSWVFSAHVVVGIMSDNRTSLPMLVPGFLCLCSAIVFGPVGRLYICEAMSNSQRYAVMLHRIQAPERASPRPAVAPPPATTTPASSSDSADTPLVVAEGTTPPRPSLLARFRTYTEDHPGVRGGLVTKKIWQQLTPLTVLLGIALILIGFQFALLPSIVPFFLCLMYSFWIPQIWRNARRGSNDAMDKTFIIGTALGRLVLPLCVFEKITRVELEADVKMFSGTRTMSSSSKVRAGSGVWSYGSLPRLLSSWRNGALEPHSCACFQHLRSSH